MGKRLLLGLLCVVGCATPPDGKLQLGPEVVEHQKKTPETDAVGVNRGRPIHIPGWAYGHVTKDGDIWGGGPVYFFAGREELSFEGYQTDETDVPH